MKKYIFSGLLLMASMNAFAQMQVDKQIQMTGAAADDRRITNLSSASAVTTPVNTDAVNIATLQSNYLGYSTTAVFATGNYTLALTPAAAQYWNGMVITFRAGAANTGNTTVNLNVLGVKPLVKAGNVQLLANDIIANQMVMAVYNPSGTGYFELATPLASVPKIQNFHVYDTGGRTNVASAVLTLQPGLTQTIIVPAGHTALAVVTATCGVANVDLTAGDFASVDFVITYDAGLLALGGYNRVTTINHASGNSITN